MENSKEPGKKKIKEEDLGTVSGGCGKKPKPKKPDPHDDEDLMTRMDCSECKFFCFWKGNYMDGIKYQCPRCDKLSLQGAELFDM